MENKVGIGSAPNSKDEVCTGMLVYSFLQCSRNCTFREELRSMGSDLQLLPDDFDDGELQTDGNRSGRCQAHGVEQESGHEEEAIRLIAEQLAQIGDELDGNIQQGLVRDVARQFMNANLSEEDRRKYLAATMERVMQAVPQELEREKATLLFALLLAKQVVNHSPTLLRSVFRTTVDYINRSLLAYTRNLARNEVA
ncbi:BH3-interacting domain death agonist [Ornithorhynchus anatinus]|uniref:BH3-interacting domain death agonist n=1 Tax=Ornithorhynchus anatinus TaxID=9258 RepID=UPI0010A925DE|nr:BH3-interacting domain death agonist [Ornithorhynchus anatinus]XP_028933940.1 BH3-interacting domain death agonist [Ornithorhynchus anatinus]XP_028933941.1 BH3-interacting domain death agonist [Ornithorhynchus anatinus]XP_028933942.1 BH3-interacting domain death agonist [Ornithorhynchus anatinus]XP_028933943.1 BH3-interacting domain death agonist [Ornithorhynchus anatinus]XP_028933944.1 BH3-interacting domain death agonist [Ornithorhynchus anatinus]